MMLLEKEEQGQTLTMRDIEMANSQTPQCVSRNDSNEVSARRSSDDVSEKKSRTRGAKRSVKDAIPRLGRVRMDVSGNR